MVNETEVKVKLITTTQNPIDVIYVACRTCYSEQGPVDMVIPESKNKKLELITKTIERGHWSVLEHISFSFAIEGVSRALTHQLVRHRIASYSQQSQRYVNYAKGDETNINNIVPKTIKQNNQAMDIYNNLHETILLAYKQLVDLGIPAEDARYVLPNSTETKIVVTMNFRELINVSQLRLCSKAQWEIVKMFKEMRKCVSIVEPELANFLKPKCYYQKYCNESNGCGLSNPVIVIK